MEELISKISAEIIKSNGETWMSKSDLDYAYGQAKLSKDAAKHCVFSIIGETSRAITDSRKAFMGFQISQPYSKNILTKCWNLNHLSG